MIPVGICDPVDPDDPVFVESKIMACWLQATNTNCYKKTGSVLNSRNFCPTTNFAIYQYIIQKFRGCIIVIAAVIITMGG